MRTLPGQGARVEVTAAAALHEPTPQKKKRKIQSQDPWLCRMDFKKEEDSNWEQEELEAKVAFCCFHCICSDGHKSKFPLDIGQYVSSSENALWHRRCCHDVVDIKDSWLSPMEKGQNDLYAELMERSEKQGNTETVDMENVETTTWTWVQAKAELAALYATAKSQESQIYNESEKEEPSSRMNSNPQYVANRKAFDKAVDNLQRDQALPSAVVLDVFAGIGSAIVSLKRLGVAMSRIIHCEHDKVASHVYKWNHDTNYNQALPKEEGLSCEHVYFESFEEVEANIEDIVNEYGPIDIVIGGPPCVDYSGANARREGVDGAQGRYMVRFGALIARMGSLKNQKGRRIHFLAENSVLYDSRDKKYGDGDRAKICKAFGIDWDPLEVDAKDFSPTRRNRHFLTNIPVEIGNMDGSSLSGSKFLQDEYKLAAHFFEENMIAKAQCFMASKSMIDGDRMCVFKDNKDNKTVTGRHINVLEREIMLGFPKGYTEDAVNDLYHHIHKFGLSNVLLTEPYWRTIKDFPKRYHKFSGNYNKILKGEFFKFDVFEGKLELDLKLAPPQITQEPSFFNKEEYAKRLLGNAFSIPVSDMLLKPLQRLFANHQYAGYKYQFEWHQKPQKHR